MRRPEIKRCPSCKRNKFKAVREQRKMGKPCDFVGKDCYFFEEIRIAIEKKKDFKIIKKDRIKFKVISKIKLPIKINKK